MTQREALKKYVAIMSATEGEVVADQTDYMQQRQAAQQLGQVACAHLLVGYVRQHLGPGKERGWWQCIACDAQFVPRGPLASHGQATK